MNPDPLASTVRLHKALAHPARLRVLAMLRDGELCACQIVAVLDLAASTVSAHMAELRRSGLVTERKDGRWVNFSLATTPAAEHVLKTVWRQLRSDAQIEDDRVLSGRLRKMGVEQLCGADFDLTQLGIRR